MIKIFLIPAFFVISCNEPKQITTISKTDNSTVVAKPIKDSIIIGKDSLPLCIKKKILSFKILEPQEQPQSVTEYEYHGKKVYYVKMPCCDFFNDLFDANCNLLGHPDGGITGRGDGKLPDFNNEKTKEKLIWKAK